MGLVGKFLPKRLFQTSVSVMCFRFIGQFALAIKHGYGTGGFPRPFG